MSPQIYWSLLAMAFVSGALMPLQAGINGLLAKEVSSVLNAATVSFLVGTMALLALALFQRDTVSIESLKNLHWWHWAGGLLGAFFVFTAAFVAPRIGALLFMVLVLLGQLSSAVFLDHQGWVGYKEIPINFGKIAGLLLILGGIWVVRRS
jgi:transporter family-2 protein